MLASWKKSYDQPREHIKKQKHYFANKDPFSQSYRLSSSYVWMWELDYKESWVLKNWFFWTVVLEKTLESPLDSKEIQPVHPEGNQSWIFIGRTNDGAETPILWSPDGKSWHIGKDPDAGKDWGREETGMTENEVLDDITSSMTWVWTSSKSWRLTGWPGVQQSMRLQRVRHDWATELNWTSSPFADDPSALPFPHHPPVTKSCLFTWCQPLYASHSAVLLHFSRYYTIRLKNIYFCVCF